MSAEPDPRLVSEAGTRMRRILEETEVVMLHHSFFEAFALECWDVFVREPMAKNVGRASAPTSEAK